MDPVQQRILPREPLAIPSASGRVPSSFVSCRIGTAKAPQEYLLRAARHMVRAGPKRIISSAERLRPAIGDGFRQYCQDGWLVPVVGRISSRAMGFNRGHAAYRALWLGLARSWGHGKRAGHIWLARRHPVQCANAHAAFWRGSSRVPAARIGQGLMPCSAPCELWPRLASPGQRGQGGNRWQWLAFAAAKQG